MKKLWIFLGRAAFWLTWPALWVYLRIGTRTRLLLICDNEYLVLKGWLGTGKWILPGGGLHRREDPIIGLLREVEEETGLHLEKAAIQPAYTDTSNQFGLSFKYSCYTMVLTQKPIVKTRQGEIVDYTWQSLEGPTLTLAQDTAQALAWWKNKR